MNKLIDNFEKLTESEKRVCNYIVKHHQDVSEMSVNQLANKVYSSKTVIIKMAQKLGFEGFTELRYYLKEFERQTEKDFESKNQTNQDIDNIYHLTHLTRKMMSESSIDAVVREILNAKTVYIAGRGTSKAAAIYFNHLLLILGIKCIIIDDYTLLTTVAERIDKNEIFIMISLSGETRKIIDATRIVKARDSTVISMTSFTYNTLTQLSDINLYIATESTDTITDDTLTRASFFILIEYITQKVRNAT